MIKNLVTKWRFAQPKQEVAVVVPVYKADMTAYETISFERCLSVLRSYPIILVAPEHLDSDKYLSVTSNVGMYRFDSRFFQDVSAYNKLMLSRAFYKRFLDYKYILVYQLDAFVFSDQLLEWCSSGYDYIGAPWLEGGAVRPVQFRGAGRIGRIVPFWNRESVCFVGNGGFSLRNVRSLLKCLGQAAITAKFWRGQEDFFFSLQGLRNDLVRIPSVDVALEFSFETNPAKCYSLNQERLPFGCHAWAKWDIAFWRPIFQDLGYNI